MIKIRPAGADDVGYLLDTYLHSFWNAPMTRGMTRDEYFGAMRPAFKRLLANPAAVVSVAAAESDPATILGWSVHCDDVLVYVYVRKDLRGNGIARELVDQYPVNLYALKSANVNGIPSGWSYRPDIAWKMMF